MRQIPSFAAQGAVAHRAEHDLSKEQDIAVAQPGQFGDCGLVDRTTRGGGEQPFDGTDA